MMQVVQLQGFFLKLKREHKSRYKYAVRQTLRQQNRLRSERMAHALMDNRGRDFWTEIRRINSKPTSVSPLMVQQVISLLLITGHPSLNLFSTLVIKMLVIL